jgi:rhodanese-related sulfurtransferase/DNA-binding transcriptional ArsR family regulator
MTDARREMFGYLAETAGVLASPSRIELVDLLAQGERSVEDLSEASHLSVANASQHLQQLRRVGVVSRRRSGRQILYDLADERVLDLMAILREMSEANHAVAQRTIDHWYHARDPLAPVTRDELTERLRRRSVRLIDVRPEIEYRAAHIPGALSIPVIVLPERLDALPKRPEVVAYCRGPYCVMAYKAVEILRPAGYRARRLDGGFMEWRRAGLPLVRGETQPTAPLR